MRVESICKAQPTIESHCCGHGYYIVIGAYHAKSKRKAAGQDSGQGRGKNPMCFAVWR